MIKPIPEQDRQRTPPLSFEAERALLGAILLHDQAINRPMEFLLPEHFADPFYGRVYQTCIDQVTAAPRPTAITIAAALREDPDLAAAGGHGFMAKLIGSSATPSAVMDYARLIYRMYVRRDLIGIGELMVSEAFDTTRESADEHRIIDVMQTYLEKADQTLSLATGKQRGGLKPPRIYIKAALELARESEMRLPGDVPGVRTGIGDLDRRTGGLLPGDYWLLAGRPGMGKSSLAQTIAFNVANRRFADGSKQYVAFFTPEMSDTQVGARLLGYDSDVSQMVQRTGPIDRDQMARLEAAAGRLMESNLWIDDAPIRFVESMAQRCRAFARDRALALIIVDYLQLVGGGRNDGRQENRAVELSMISSALKALAKELGVPLIALSQLNRAVEQREDKRPLLSDLRDSGGLEQDADLVSFVYRDWYYLNQHNPKKGPNETREDYANRVTRHEELLNETLNVSEVIFAKTRHGPTGTVKIYFDPPRQHFTNLAPEGTDDLDR